MRRKIISLLSLSCLLACSNEAEFSESASGNSRIVADENMRNNDDAKPIDNFKSEDKKDAKAVVTEATCATKTFILRSGESASMKWQLPAGASQLQISLKAEGESFAGALGLTQVISANEVLYTAPDVVSKGVRINVSVDPSKAGASCFVNLLANEDIGVADDGHINGLIGHVYALPENTNKLPDFSQLQSQATIVVPNLDIPTRTFTAGFPGIADLFEWFGVRFSGRLEIAEAGDYEFRLTSDDGAILVIDGVKVVDNDGLHATTSVNGSTNLSAGFHNIRIDYYQGPRYEIALQVAWRKAGSSNPFVIVPAEVLSRPN